MVPLDNLERITAKMREPNAADVLFGHEKEAFTQIPEEEKIKTLKNLITAPVDYAVWPMYDWFFRTRWLEALQAAKLAAPASMLEIASGSTDMLPKILSKFYSHPKTRYATANLNKQLTAEFKAKTKDLPLKIDVIEDAAQKIENYFGDNKLDVVVFEHSFNDVVETMFADKHGIDTINASWWDILPQLIKATNDAYTDGTYETVLKGEFLQMISSLLNILKPNSFLISHQFQYQGDLDLGIIPEIWPDLISTARKWLKEKNLGTEVFFDGFEPKYWMFLKNT
jgi:hypothetical protein